MENFGQNVLASSVALLLIMAVMGVVYFIWSTPTWHPASV